MIPESSEIRVFKMKVQLRLMQLSDRLCVTSETNDGSENEREAEGSRPLVHGPVSDGEQEAPPTSDCVCDLGADGGKALRGRVQGETVHSVCQSLKETDAAADRWTGGKLVTHRRGASQAAGRLRFKA